jgi:hypothetical protein
MNDSGRLITLESARPVWPVVFGMAVMLLVGLPFVLRRLWPALRPRTAWLVSLAVVFVFLFVMTPARVAISSILRGGQPM